jgi:hypothetical protein
MNARTHFGRLAAGLAATLLLAACAGSSSPTARPSAPSMTPPASAPSPAAAEPWDLVFFSDSSLGDVPDRWAARIRERLGIEVRVHTWPEGPGSTPRDLLQALEDRADVRDAIAGAELIGIETVPVGTEPGYVLAETCVPADPTPRDPPPVYSVADLTEYAGQLRSIFDRIFELRAGQPTIIRAMDIYTPVLDQWTAAGIESACTAGWEAHSGTIRMVADEYGVTTASIYDLFNGVGHHEDPVDKGWIGDDGVHPNAAGTAAQVEFLDSLGYEAIER